METQKYMGKNQLIERLAAQMGSRESALDLLRARGHVDAAWLCHAAFPMRPGQASVGGDGDIDRLTCAIGLAMISERRGDPRFVALDSHRPKEFLALQQRL